ncbi:hypothetical protein ARAM_007649 [Aspergillus rambellii]|uniref:Uncharacterized protein n=1 Tax=Aspergillus rambellii TaxID=308745 RepID=A0A0F8X741_9EURO|nr:hypothetical protein ARAM_007649 [Aspergillus rambellii]
MGKNADLSFAPVPDLANDTRIMLQYRRSKAHNPMRSTSIKRHDTQFSTSSTQLRRLQLQTPGLDYTNYHVRGPDGKDSCAKSNRESEPAPIPNGPSKESIGVVQDDQDNHLNAEDPGTSEEQNHQSVEHSVSELGEEAPNPITPRETELLAANERLIEQQKDVSAKRLQVRESRLALRYKREKELELRARLMKDLNSFFANHHLPAGDPILREYELLQGASQEYSKMENNYHQQEDDLEMDEYMLTLSMESFAGLSENGPWPDLQDHLALPATQLEHDALDETPPCVINYLSRIGDERMLQERLSDLESEWFLTIEKQAQRHHLQLPLDKESEEFLQNFDSLRQKVWRDLNNAQLDVNELRIICVDQGIQDFDYEDLASLHQYPNETVFHQEKDPLKLPPQANFHFFLDLDPADYPTAQNPDCPANSYFFLFRELERAKGFGATEFINRWMLHQLRISSMGIWQLQLLLDWQALRDQGWQDGDISQNALDRWFSDEAAMPSSPSDSYTNNGRRSKANSLEMAQHIKSPSLPLLTKVVPASGRLRRHSIQ